jgi:hypothetical protein
MELQEKFGMSDTPRTDAIHFDNSLADHERAVKFYMLCRELEHGISDEIQLREKLEGDIAGLLAGIRDEWRSNIVIDDKSSPFQSLVVTVAGLVGKITQLEAEVARLNTPPLWIQQCQAHKDIPWAGTFKAVSFTPPGRTVCPICHPEEMKLLMEAK